MKFSCCSVHNNNNLPVKYMVFLVDEGDVKKVASSLVLRILFVLFAAPPPNRGCGALPSTPHVALLNFQLPFNLSDYPRLLI